MNPQTRHIPEEEYEALCEKVMACAPVIKRRGPFTTLWMVTDDFEPTQNMAAARFIAWDNYMDRALLQVDGAGNAILIEASEE